MITEEKIKAPKKNGMQHYVDYLLEDIRNAEKEPEPQPPILTPFDFFPGHDEIERLMTEEPSHTFGKLSGLIAEQFPPGEKLSNRQMKKIVKAFEKLLFSWNLSVDIPKKFPIDRHYKILLEVLNKKIHVLDYTHTEIGFCSGENDTCPYGTFCHCREYGDIEIGFDKKESHARKKKTQKKQRE